MIKYSNILNILLLENLVYNCLHELPRYETHFECYFIVDGLYSILKYTYLVNFFMNEESNGD